jgi:hypothetical protein
MVNEIICWIVDNHDTPRVLEGGYRRVNLKVFPYYIAYIVRNETLWILAVADANQQLQKKVLEQGLYFAKIHDEQFSLCVPKGFKPFCFTGQ